MTPTCAHCGKPFSRTYTTMQAVCSPRCARALVTAKRKAKERAEREQLRARKQAAKRRPELLAEAQAAFNRYIKFRDYGMPCICCGKAMPWGDEMPGGSIDAGHFLSRGSTPELRFDERNVHAQLKSCNRPGGTTRNSFRYGMIARVGLKVVEWLEGPHEPRKYTRDELIALRDEYRAKARL
jgi:endogenous inhibitor of DNA gyrase (YacG/DUF329 family)